MISEALESVIRYARNKMLSEVSEMDDKTEAIAYKGLIPVYEQNHSYSVGDVRLHPTTGNPKECILAYDGSIQPDWTIDTSTLWKPWHSRKPEYALPWEAPTGAHEDRKSTRLNSSHVSISYAVFCLKKKKTKHQTVSRDT